MVERERSRCVEVIDPHDAPAVVARCPLDSPTRCAGRELPGNVEQLDLDRVTHSIVGRLALREPPVAEYRLSATAKESLVDDLAVTVTRELCRGVAVLAEDGPP